MPHPIEVDKALGAKTCAIVTARIPGALLLAFKKAVQEDKSTMQAAMTEAIAEWLVHRKERGSE